jgi:hypothetical protein
MLSESLNLTADIALLKAKADLAALEKDYKERGAALRALIRVLEKEQPKPGARPPVEPPK